MNHLFNLLLITLLLINLTGITLAGKRITGLPYGLAKAATITGGCLLFFFFEHFVGLGGLGLLLPFSTLGCLWIIWKQRLVLRQNLAGEAVFLVGFGYTLAWRYCFPNIDPSSEKMADLNFIAGYLPGSRLPTPDLWLPPYQLTQYYSFQHYGAALMGRILQVSCGTAYNLGYCVLVGLVMAPARDFIRAFTTSRLHQVLVLAALLVGGTGACIFTPLMVKHETLFSSMRFIGATNADNDDTLTPLGIALRNASYGPAPYSNERRDKDILEMPMEIFSYVVQLGDYHAPIGGYLLLTTSLAAFGVLLRQPSTKARRWASAVLVATAPLCIIINTWTFPLQTILVGCCVLYLWAYREKPDWPALLGGMLLTLLLLYPNFSYFLPRNVGAAMKIELLQPNQHPPILSYLMQLWPVLGLVFLGLFAVGPQQREYRWFSILVAGFLILLESINVNDLYGGRFERFNTTLKWWPWVAALALLLLAPLCLAATGRRKIVRWGTCAILVCLLFFLKLLSYEWREGLRQPKLAIGQLDGAGWLRASDAEPPPSTNLGVTASILNYLQARPGGICLEAPLKDDAGFDRMGFVETGAIPLFTGHPTVFGWASHEQLWRGYQRDVEQRWNRTREFFTGDMVAPLDFLDSYEVRYILWPAGKNVDRALFDKISQQISSRYIFVRFDEGDPTKGIWQRR